MREEGAEVMREEEEASLETEERGVSLGRGGGDSLWLLLKSLRGGTIVLWCQWPSHLLHTTPQSCKQSENKLLLPIRIASLWKIHALAEISSQCLQKIHKKWSLVDHNMTYKYFLQRNVFSGLTQRERPQWLHLVLRLGKVQAATSNHWRWFYISSVDLLQADFRTNGTFNDWLGIGSNSSWLDAVGSPPPAGDPEELIVTGGIDDVVKIWRYRFLSFDFPMSMQSF